MASKRGAGVMEHSELVSEISVVEKMSTAERLKHAKKRRQQQLKKFNQYDKQIEKEQKSKKKSMSSGGTKRMKFNNNGSRRVMFINNIMLLESAARNDIDEVGSLLKSGVSPDVTNEDGLTALHQCCIDDLEGMMKLLIEHKANVNARDSELWTPLHAAATCGHIHLCRYLIDNGAELLAVNADGNMPYDICEDEMTLDVIESEMAKRGVTQEIIDDTRLSTEKQMLEDLKKLAEEGEGLEFRGRNMETPLHIAAANGYIQVTEFLVQNHVTLDVQDEDSWQPIHAAACWGHLPVLEILVSNGASLDAKTRNGESPLDICEDPEIKERILEIKNEIETNKRTKPERLVRRRSTNTRRDGHMASTSSLYSSNTSLSEKNHLSASVRRTSMREKTQISWKEAREEAQRLRESDHSQDEEEEEDESEKQNNTESRVNGVSQDHVPSTNIDDVAVSLPDDKEDEEQEQESETKEEEDVAPPIHIQSGIDSLKKSKDSLAGSKENIKTASKHMFGGATKDKPFTPSSKDNVKQSSSDTSINTKRQAPQPPPAQKESPRPTPPQQNSSSKKEEDKENVSSEQPTVHSTKTTEGAPPSQANSHSAESVDSKETNGSSASVPNSQSNSQAPYKMANVSAPPTIMETRGRSPSQGSIGAVGHPRTLAELKAERMHERQSHHKGMFTSENTYLHSSNDNISNGPHTNGQNGSAQTAPSYTYIAGDPPKKKFSSTTEIVGDNDKGCCIVM